MSKKDDFKEFVRSKPELIKYVTNNEMTWQKFYEIYDLYGNDEKVWQKYSKVVDNSLQDGFSKISNIVKNIDLDSLKEHLNQAQKAIDFVTDLASKKSTKNILPVSNEIIKPRPINKFFED